MSRICWLDGAIVSPDAAHVSLFDHGLLYGDGVFEGLRFYGRRIFRADAHLARLAQSARAISLELPYELPRLGAGLEAVAAQHDADDGYLRLVITRGEGDLGLNPRSCPRPRAFILSGAVSTMAAGARGGASVVIASTRQSSPAELDPRIKSLNYLPRILARLEANRARADEAIMLNQAGTIAEGTADNVFVVRSGRLLTPPVTDGALEGITRAAVLELAEKLGVPAEVRSLGPLDLRIADEAFLTGTATELVPIAQVDGTPLATPTPGPIFTRLAEAFAALVRAP